MRTHLPSALACAALAWAATACVPGRPRPVEAPPAWQTDARLDKETPALLRLRPAPSARYLTCYLFTTSFDGDESSELAQARVDGRMAATTFQEIASADAEGVGTRRWSGLTKVALAGSAPGAAPSAVSDASSVLFESSEVVRLTSRNFPEKGAEVAVERVDQARPANEFKYELPVRFAHLDYPEAAVYPGWTFREEKRDVVSNPLVNLRDELVVEQTWTFLGIDRHPAGDAWLFSVEGEVRQTTVTDVISADGRGFVAGGLRIGVRDGMVSRRWYVLDAQVHIAPVDPTSGADDIDARVRIRLDQETREYAPSEPFPPPFGGEFAHDPCASWSPSL